MGPGKLISPNMVWGSMADTLSDALGFRADGFLLCLDGGAGGSPQVSSTPSHSGQKEWFGWICNLPDVNRSRFGFSSNYIKGTSGLFPAPLLRRCGGWLLILFWPPL